MTNDKPPSPFKHEVTAAIARLDGVAARNTSELSHDNIRALILENERLTAELAELRDLHKRINASVMPGVQDTGECAAEMIKRLEAELTAIIKKYSFLEQDLLDSQLTCDSLRDELAAARAEITELERICYKTKGYAPGFTVKIEQLEKERDEALKREEIANARACEAEVMAEAAYKEIKMLKNPSDGRCMEIGALRDYRDKLIKERDEARAEIERLRAALEFSKADDEHNQAD